VLTTNRDLYRAIGELGERYASSGRTLEHYLLALLGLARQHNRQDALSLSEFYQVVSEAFSADPIPFASAWRDTYGALNPNQSGFVGWEATVIRQIVDLREMDEAGTLAYEYRYFGVDAPRGSRWYNFDPVTYLECAMAGSLGGWEPDDPTGRQFVPGEVGVMDSIGNLQIVNPQDIERPIGPLPQVSWDQFKDFVECGQMYE
jgi:hypothetical protein